MIAKAYRDKRRKEKEKDFPCNENAHLNFDAIRQALVGTELAGNNLMLV